MNDQNNTTKGGPAPRGIEESRQSLSKMLYDARQVSGMSLDAMAQITKISRNYIEALETGEFEKLPGAVFGRGFVLSMARVLGLDADEVARIYANCWSEVESLNVRKPVGGEIMRPSSRLQPLMNFGSVSFRSFFNSVKINVLPAFKLSRSQSVAVLVSLPVIALVIAVVTATVKRQQQAKPQQTMASVTPDQVDPGVDDREGEELTADSNDSNLANSKAQDSATTAVAGDQSQLKDTAANQADEPLLEVSSQRANFEHVLELVVIEPVKLKLKLDDGKVEVRQLRPDAYRFTFSDYAEMTVYDAAAIELAFNGRSLGSLGGKGRIRNLVFKSGAPEQATVSGKIGEPEKKL